MPAVQLGIFVLDASGSMNDPIADEPPGTTKAWQIEEMLCRPLPESMETAADRKAALNNCGIIARLQESKRRDFIDLGIIRYDTHAEVYQEVRPILEWELSPPGTKLNPPTSSSTDRYMLGGEMLDLMKEMGGATNIAVGLAEANKMKDAYLKHWDEQEGNFEPYITIILMSDLLQNVGTASEPLDIAAKIKRTVNDPKRNREQVLLATAAFGDNADLELMKQIATDPKYAVKTTDPVKLREFFLKSLTIQLG